MTLSSGVGGSGFDLTADSESVVLGVEEGKVVQKACTEECKVPSKACNGRSSINESAPMQRLPYGTHSVFSYWSSLPKIALLAHKSNKNNAPASESDTPSTPLGMDELSDVSSPTETNIDPFNSPSAITYGDGRGGANVGSFQRLQDIRSSLPPAEPTSPPALSTGFTPVMERINTVERTLHRFREDTLAEERLQVLRQTFADMEDRRRLAEDIAEAERRQRHDEYAAHMLNLARAHQRLLFNRPGTGYVTHPSNFREPVRRPENLSARRTQPTSTPNSASVPPAGFLGVSSRAPTHPSGFTNRTEPSRAPSRRNNRPITSSTSTTASAAAPPQAEVNAATQMGFTGIFANTISAANFAPLRNSQASASTANTTSHNSRTVTASAAVSTTASVVTSAPQPARPPNVTRPGFVPNWNSASTGPCVNTKAKSSDSSAKEKPSGTFGTRPKAKAAAASTKGKASTAPKSFGLRFIRPEDRAMHELELKVLGSGSRTNPFNWNDSPSNRLNATSPTPQGTSGPSAAKKAKVSSNASVQTKGVFLLSSLPTPEPAATSTQVNSPTPNPHRRAPIAASNISDAVTSASTSTSNPRKRTQPTSAPEPSRGTNRRRVTLTRLADLPSESEKNSSDENQPTDHVRSQVISGSDDEDFVIRVDESPPAPAPSQDTTAINDLATPGAPRIPLEELPELQRSRVDPTPGYTHLVNQLRHLAASRGLLIQQDSDSPDEFENSYTELTAEELEALEATDHAQMDGCDENTGN
ncbi:hypothetical protein CPB83DRAFT_841252 [Crepidotus variabilis]|uniref:Uncharacterized protein n=1 Tax=Crepidotus variabilis TaxID=179855 RepID=A0A9P6BBX9_9AGAR|nr:hypothetical protein CPB83DRAFT_841252 [Crepidotus variabilis]